MDFASEEKKRIEEIESNQLVIDKDETKDVCDEDVQKTVICQPECVISHTGCPVGYKRVGPICVPIDD
ncbi:unnamed protein product [Danaus chrysippus]|uniref:(African queen) hypothetical protein n=1 Tax=Danaus chrysippus TaxID=151541 RepID=A0A8J2VPG8_9NEOP|nr:unnamed protein product [Danaus chrysippus]